VHKRLFTVLGWLGTVVVLVALRSTLIAAPISITEMVVWMFVAAAPVLVMLTLSRNAAPSSVAQVLYDAEQGRSDRR
jgi:hypothetical protein